MTVMQQIRRDRLKDQLAGVGSKFKIWPVLDSDNKSLHHQPAVAGILRQLGQCEQIILCGPAGSGKTVLCLYLALFGKGSEIVYLEAQGWAPPKPNEDVLEDLLIKAGCDHSAAMRAFRERKLIIILDAIDEAPWRAGGTSLPGAVAKLSQAVDKKAGLLLTSRTRQTVPSLHADHSFAEFRGIHPNEIESFLAQYTESRSGVSELVARLKTMPFSDAIKYSPLVLRMLAKDIELKKDTKNLAELFERMADAQIRRECSKPELAQTPGTWQEAYADEKTHRQLVNTLVFSYGATLTTIDEEEFKGIVQDVLQPRSLGARALVEISTLMAEHPLVTIRYSDKEGRDQYVVDCSREWVRTGLLPKFMTEDALIAQLRTSEVWPNTLPYPQDFVSAWSYLGTRGPEILTYMESLISNNDKQAESVCKWLVGQLFNPDCATDIKPMLYSAIATLSYRFVRSSQSVMDKVDIAGFPVIDPTFTDVQLTLDSTE